MEKVKIWHERGYVIKEIWNALQEIMNINIPEEEVPMEITEQSEANASEYQAHHVYDINKAAGKGDIQKVHCCPKKEICREGLV